MNFLVTRRVAFPLLLLLRLACLDHGFQGVKRDHELGFQAGRQRPHREAERRNLRNLLLGRFILAQNSERLQIEKDLDLQLVRKELAGGLQLRVDGTKNPRIQPSTR